VFINNDDDDKKHIFYIATGGGSTYKGASFSIRVMTIFKKSD